MQYPKGEYTAKHVVLGQQGIVDVLINRALADKLVKQLEKVKLKDLLEEYFFSVFQHAFEDNNFIVKINTEPYCVKRWRLYSNKYCTNGIVRKDYKMAKLGIQTILCFTYDYKPIVEDLDVDYLLVIDLKSHGTGRTYFSFVPTSPPKGFTQLISYLIDGKTGEVLSQHFLSIIEPVQGEWDETPEYANLMQAAKRSFEIAIDEVFIDIFKAAP